ncbi:FAD-dependent oxidoreductase [Nocardioides humilatus]|uniref:FAD-dependent oxidoreductase n=1 Tax=Nocardioides humilatus TaxID=2607660 RepID=A0A5B1L8H5_9ACTN|nr:FAD-dependent oxidoreductase [Nocardioides humilatus]KAA1416922.1 FAD-dependent oxidoreductase [Nocardioides humilatus]
MTGEQRHFVVVGGGLAGLASAVWLTEAGQRVTLLERRGSLGGRTIAMPQPAVDDVPDNGQHVFASGYENVFRYLESVGTREHVCFPGRLGYRFPGDDTTSTSLHNVDKFLKRVPGITVGERLRAAAATLRLMAQSLRQPHDLDAITAAEWFDRLGMPRSVQHALWDGMTIGLTGDKPELSAAKPLADLMATGAKQALKLRTPISIGYPTVDLDTLYLAGARRVFAERGVDVRHRAVVRSIDVEDGAVTGVTLTDGERVPADAVICAVPVWSIRGLLDQVPGHEEVYRAAEILQPVPIVSVNLYLDRSIGMQEWGEVLYDGLGVLEQVWDRQRMHGRSPERSWFYSTTVSASYDLIGLSNAEITGRQMEMLRRYYPEARDAQVLHSHVVRMPRSTITQHPGSFGVRPGVETQVDGLALAGDWLQTGWTITMEGACQSAARAVDHLLSVTSVRSSRSPRPRSSRASL